MRILEDIEVKEIMSAPPVIVKTEGFTGLSPKRRENLSKLVERIASLCKQKRIRPQEFFNDHDKLRRGLLAQPKFVTALDQMKLDLEDSLVDILCDGFRDPNNTDLIRHKDFSEEIETYFCNKNLEKDPLAEMPKDTIKGCLDPNDVLNDDEEIVLGETLRRLNRQSVELRM